ncbi:TetR family transcriptional regulator [Isoptericola sp. CG 20/1183]|uniref:TetR family transcriptional regulator n=1 Tax=Isoptericola halotolerans TaxID=300560 RepID=A0ABX5EI17_9MICO|nr:MULTISPECIES: TetR/AcrR family transcriptional regulator [Isoptericola]MCK0118204.1 TetR/AcrR family transcriptional regulator [Isoptericola sp. S6320L]PRZ09311.1 TetR family transcriptional regulator [Isoptericola sp. CG 20/1183]PRZ10112.1 TetR family transcriptional regulator [Isoptericola halotolerans]
MRTTEHVTSVRSPRRTRTRERLLDAALDVFAEVGMQATSIEAVCEAAGFTRGAFYSNFASKEELFLALMQRDATRQLGALEQAVETIDAGSLGTPEGFRAALGTVMAAVRPDGSARRQWCLVAAEFELLALRDAAVAELYLTEHRRIRAEVGAVLDRILEGLGLRFVVDMPTAVDLLMSAEDAAGRADLLERPAAGAGEPAPPTRRLEALVDLLLAPREDPPAT